MSYCYVTIAGAIAGLRELPSDAIVDDLLLANHRLWNKFVIQWVCQNKGPKQHPDVAAERTVVV